MKGFTKLPKKQLYGILGPLGILILILSLEVMMKTKDLGLFNEWVLRSKEFYPRLNEQSLFNIYVSGNISLYFQKIIIPIGLSLHSYIAYTYIRINKLFVFMWTVLSIGGLAYTVSDLSIKNPLMYIYILLYLLVLGTLFSLIGVIDNHENS